MNLSMISVALISTLLFLTEQCGKEEVGEGAPDCVREMIDEISQQDVWNPPAKVYSYFYDGKKVYFVPARCCDIRSELYDENCNLLCAPDGGFSGSGDGNCADFFQTRTDERLVWEDKRK